MFISSVRFPGGVASALGLCIWLMTPGRIQPPFCSHCVFQPVSNNYHVLWTQPLFLCFSPVYVVTGSVRDRVSLIFRTSWSKFAADQAASNMYLFLPALEH